MIRGYVILAARLTEFTFYNFTQLKITLLQQAREIMSFVVYILVLSGSSYFPSSNLLFEARFIDTCNLPLVWKLQPRVLARPLADGFALFGLLQHLSTIWITF